MNKPDFISKNEREWYVGETLNQCFDINNQREFKKNERTIKDKVPCECLLAGWLICDEEYFYCATQGFKGSVYAAIYAGKNTKTEHDDKPEINIKANPYLIYALGCDDVSYSIRFKTEEEMLDCLKNLKTFNDLATHKNVLWNN